MMDVNISVLRKKFAKMKAKNAEEKAAKLEKRMQMCVEMGGTWDEANQKCVC